MWATCLLFFQTVLLLGYAYAYLSVRRLTARSQALLHLILLVSSALLLPVVPGPRWKPPDAGAPGRRILELLAATVGVPYFVLSATSPLLQAWYARRRGGAAPYRLFALSNAGSMLALLGYPFVVEPTVSTRAQAAGWSLGYLVFGLLCGAVAVDAMRAGRAPGAAAEGVPAPDAPPSRTRQLLWLALAACPSALLLAVTGHLSRNVAPIPLLWVLPLALYLLSFVLCFAEPGRYRRDLYLPLLALALGSMAYALGDGDRNLDLRTLIPLFAGGLFVCCMVCHGELARSKPHPRYLTAFYLMCALGGAVGGALAGLVAPAVFQGDFDLPILLAAAAVLVLIVMRVDPSGAPREGPRRRLWLGAAGLALGMTVYLGYGLLESAGQSRIMARNFYGTLRVSDSGDGRDRYATRVLNHGTITHGEQFLDPDLRTRPITYYGPDSGVGLALREAARQPAIHVGVIGLGAGTLAAYGRRGDRYRFYEINPLVVRLAETEFTYLWDSEAEIEVVLGDARLSLEREPRQAFDVLVVDAFSSDAIPVHLLTREALALYARHLAEGGVLAVHVSNRHLDLAPVVRLAAESLGQRVTMVDTYDPEEGDEAAGDAAGEDGADEEREIWGSTWVLVSGRESFFESPLIRNAGTAIDYRPGLRMWTDDYSNLFQILR